MRRIIFGSRHHQIPSLFPDLASLIAILKTQTTRVARSGSVRALLGLISLRESDGKADDKGDDREGGDG